LRVHCKGWQRSIHRRGEGVRAVIETLTVDPELVLDGPQSALRLDGELVVPFPDLLLALLETLGRLQSRALPFAFVIPAKREHECRE
jgi:hypothetical protein